MRWLLEWLVPPTYRPSSSVGERLACHGVVGLDPSSGLFFSLTLAAGIFPFDDIQSSKRHRNCDEHAIYGEVHTRTYPP